jgi:hypothetical protein
MTLIMRNMCSATIARFVGVDGVSPVLATNGLDGHDPTASQPRRAWLVIGNRVRSIQSTLGIICARALVIWRSCKRVMDRTEMRGFVMALLVQVSNGWI